MIYWLFNKHVCMTIILICKSQCCVYRYVTCDVVSGSMHAISIVLCPAACIIIMLWSRACAFKLLPRYRYTGSIVGHTIVQWFIQVYWYQFLSFVVDKHLSHDLYNHLKNRATRVQTWMAKICNLVLDSKRFTQQFLVLLWKVKGSYKSHNSNRKMLNWFYGSDHTYFNCIISPQLIVSQILSQSDRYHPEMGCYY